MFLQAAVLWILDVLTGSLPSGSRIGEVIEVVKNRISSRISAASRLRSSASRQSRKVVGYFINGHLYFSG